MTIAVTCPCGGRFAAQLHLAGKTVRCPQCQQALQVPLPVGQPLAPIINPFSDTAPPVAAELVPPAAAPAPAAPFSQDPFGGKATVSGPQGGGVGSPQATATYAKPDSYSPPPTAYDPVGNQPSKKSNVVLYVIGAVVLGFVGFAFVAGLGIYQFVKEISNLSFEDSQPLAVQDEDYTTARARFKTKLTSRGEAPQEWSDLETPRGAAELIYQSDGRSLRAFCSPVPADGTPRPGVVFLHGGFAWDETDWAMSQPYRDQGFVVMTPVLRAENGQPGHFSLYYDEVDDVLAATAAFAALPYVDETQLYISGHSAGGTLATLAAMTSDRFQAMASFSGSMNQQGVAEWDPALEVYDTSNINEVLMRSPEAYAKSFKCPAQLYYGSDEPWFPQETKRTAATARGAGLEVEVIVVPGDHASSVRPAMLGSIGFFRRIALASGKQLNTTPPTPRIPEPYIAIPNTPPRTPMELVPPRIHTPKIPTPQIPTPQIPTPDFPVPGAAGVDSSRNFPRPPTSALPTGPNRFHQGVLTLEVIDYSGRVPRVSAARRGLIRIPWADKARIENDEANGVLRVHVRKGPTMDAEAAKAALEKVGFEIGTTSFQAFGTETAESANE